MCLYVNRVVRGGRKVSGVACGKSAWRQKGRRILATPMELILYAPPALRVLLLLLCESTRKKKGRNEGSLEGVCPPLLEIRPSQNPMWATASSPANKKTLLVVTWLKPAGLAVLSRPMHPFPSLSARGTITSRRWSSPPRITTE